MKATLLRPGMIIQHEGDLYAVFSVEHRTPGNKRGSMQTKLRNLRSGTISDYRFRAEDQVDRAILDEVEFQFLYGDTAGYHFMNTENYEQIHLGKEILGDATDYLIPDMNVKIEFHDGTALGVSLPDTVDLKVTDTEPGLQRATASSVMKPATLETGLVVHVPPFISIGEKIKVNTAEGTYVSRA
ncbi:MAG: elongation factor P [Candidatus Acidiferrales bacterium]